MLAKGVCLLQITNLLGGQTKNDARKHPAVAVPQSVHSLNTTQINTI